MLMLISTELITFFKLSYTNNKARSAPGLKVSRLFIWELITWWLVG